MDQKSGSTKAPESNNQGYKKSKEIDTVKKQEEKNNTLDKAKQAEEEHVQIVNTVETCMNPKGVQSLSGVVQDVTNSTILTGFAEARAGRWQKVQSSSWYAPRCQRQRDGNTGVWCGKNKSFQIS